MAHEYSFRFAVERPLSEDERLRLETALWAQTEDYHQTGPARLAIRSPLPSVQLRLLDSCGALIAYSVAGDTRWQDPHGGEFSESEQTAMRAFATGRADELVLDQQRSRGDWLSLRLVVVVS